MQRIINDIIEHFGTDSSSDAREALICDIQREVVAKRSDDDKSEPLTSSAILVRATGPSFPQAIGSPVGFSNATTCFGLELDSAAKEIWNHFVRMAEFAKNVFIEQSNRCFVRSLIVTNRQAQLFHFDRSGALYSPLFDIHEKPEVFIRLVLGLTATNERTLGLDTSIRWTTSPDGTNTGSLETIERGERVLYHLAGDEAPITRSSLQGRGTTCWVAKSARGERVIIKDYWVVDGQVPEFELLEEAKGLRGVCQIVSYEHNRARTRDFRCDTSISVKGSFQNRTSVRIVMKAYGPTIESFTSIEQLLGTLRDAIAAHRALVAKNIIHRDVSPSNILLGKDAAPEGDRGVIIDLDHALRMSGLSSEVLVDFKMGTQLFQPLMALKSCECLPGYIPLYDYLDDLEAFFWVLSYLILTYTPEGARMPPNCFLDDTIEGWLKEPGLAHTHKRYFLHSYTIDYEIRHSIHPGWFVILEDFFFGFHAFVREINSQKSKLVYTSQTHLPDGSLAPNRFNPILVKMDEHYDRVLALFDNALKKIKRSDLDVATEPVNSFPKTSSIPSSESTNSTGTTRDECASVTTSATSKETSIESHTSTSPTNPKPTSTSNPLDSSPLSIEAAQPILRSKRRYDDAELDDESPKESKRSPAHENRDRVRKLLGQDLASCILEASSSWVDRIYEDISTPSEISEYLDANAGYQNGRWTILPELPSSAADLHDPVRDLINSIIEHFGTREALEDREAMLCDIGRVLDDNDDEERKTYISRTVLIRAAGPSFSPSVGSCVGFSNTATCFGTELDSAAEELWSQLLLMAEFAKNVFIEQPNRRFVRSVIITERQAQLFHFDRSGVQYSPLFDVHQKPETLIRIVLGLATTNEEILGFDTSVHWKKSPEGMKIGGSVETRGSDNTKTTYDLCPGEDQIGRCDLLGRGTTCWIVKNDQGERFIVKDYWVVDGQASEFKFLEEVKGMRGVCQVVSYEGNRARTRDFRDHPSDVVKGAFQNRTSVRIVMKAYGRSIESFTSIEQLLGAFRDAIAAHKALISRNIIHRDVSPDNILLGEQDAEEGTRAVIIDLDHALRMSGLSSEVLVNCKVGTHLFQPLMALRSCDFAPAYTPLYDYLDDLEAFFWVFAYLVLTYKPNGERMPDERFFYERIINGWLAPPSAAHDFKDHFLKSPMALYEIRHAIDSGWLVIYEDLFLGFRTFTQEISDQKSMLVYESPTILPDGSLAPNRFEPILEKIDEHYAHVLALFDDALEHIERVNLDKVPNSPLPPSDPATASTSVPTSQSTNSDRATSDGPASVATSTTSPTRLEETRPKLQDTVTLSTSPGHSSRQKRSYDEADLEDGLPEESERRCPPNRQGILHWVYHLYRGVF
ncbi:hypothetical protein MD484_g6114, partial [Candolleomyces efflorescens]